jgi:DNA-binding transcriptional LysR family regulator
LEADLGVPLFDRLGKRIVLTDAGQRLLRYAEKILALAEEARSVVTGEAEPNGSLTISAPESLCTYRLPAVLGLFRERYPRVQLMFRPSPSADMRRRVSEGLLDIAFVLEEPIHSGNLSARQLINEPLLVIAPPDHPLTSKAKVNVADLSGEPILFTETGCTYRRIFEQALIDGGVYPPTALEFSSVEAIKQCVITGMGITVLPAMAVNREINEGLLVALNWAGPKLEVITQMIWHKDKWLSPALHAFIEVTYEVLQPLLAANKNIQRATA